MRQNTAVYRRKLLRRPCSLAAGDRVRHPMFGEGLILSANKMGADTLYEVAFDTVGTKKLMATFAKLTKI